MQGHHRRTVSQRGTHCPCGDRRDVPGGSRPGLVAASRCREPRDCRRGKLAWRSGRGGRNRKRVNGSVDETSREGGGRGDTLFEAPLHGKRECSCCPRFLCKYRLPRCGSETWVSPRRPSRARSQLRRVEPHPSQGLETGERGVGVAQGPGLCIIFSFALLYFFMMCHSNPIKSRRHLMSNFLHDIDEDLALLRAFNGRAIHRYSGLARIALRRAEQLSDSSLTCLMNHGGFIYPLLMMCPCVTNRGATWRGTVHADRKRSLTLLILFGLLAVNT